MLRLFFALIMCCFTMAHAESSQTLTKVRLSLGWHVDPCQGPIIYALETGIFKKYGLDVEIMPASGGEESSRAVAIGMADIGITKLANHIVRVSNGMPLSRIGTLVAKPLEILLSHTEIKAAEDLCGKTIGYATSNPAFTMCVIEKALTSYGLKENDVTLVAFQKGLAQAFMNKSIDVAFTATDPYETIMCRDKGVSHFTKPYADFGIPSFEQFILFTNKNASQAAYIPLFNTALREAIRDIKGKPVEAWQTICGKYPEMDTKLNYHIWLNLVQHFQDDPNTINFEAYQTLLDFMNKAKVSGKPLLPHKVELSDILPLIE